MQKAGSKRTCSSLKTNPPHRLAGGTANPSPSASFLFGDFKTGAICLATSRLQQNEGGREHKAFVPVPWLHHREGGQRLDAGLSGSGLDGSVKLKCDLFEPRERETVASCFIVQFIMPATVTFKPANRQIFYFMCIGIFSPCIYICASHACLVAAEAGRGCQEPELEMAMSIHIGAGNSTWVL